MSAPLWRRCLAAILGSKPPAVEHVRAPHDRWVVEMLDGGDWMTCAARPTKAEADADAARRPTSWADGSTVQIRVVREHTTYTLEAS